jgi:hypothetical protein
MVRILRDRRGNYYALAQLRAQIICPERARASASQNREGQMTQAGAPAIHDFFFVCKPARRRSLNYIKPRAQAGVPAPHKQKKRQAFLGPAAIILKQRRSMLRLRGVVTLLFLCRRFLFGCAGFRCSCFWRRFGRGFLCSGSAARVDQVKSILSIERELAN